MKRLLFFCVIGVMSFMGAHGVSAQSTTSPTVQIVSYDSAYGIYPVMLGWGSGSLIDNNGLIVTNNHVIENYEGDIASAFRICIAQGAGVPECNYTAELVARDPGMDIALLRLHAQDISGNAVNFSSLPTIEVDYEYVPHVEDEVRIIGYPWIGANTQTQTKGIVSGTIEYNSHTYIKTDAIIAGGNSGGAMINERGALVGVPTFTIGGYSDSNLGYGLLISEAQSFIQEHAGDVPQAREGTAQLAKMYALIDAANATGVIQDQFMTFRFPKETYEVEQYAPGRAMTLVGSEQREDGVYSLSTVITQTPALEDKEDFFYFLERLGFYYPEDQEPKEITIGGRTFYSFVYKNDGYEGSRDDYTQYVGQLSSEVLMSISVEVPLSSDRLRVQGQEALSTLLGGFSFPQESQISTDSFQFKLANPKVSFVKDANALLNDYAGYAVYLFGDSLDERFAVSVSLDNEYSGVGLSAEDIFESDTSGIPRGNKSLISFQGVQGYIACAPQGNTGTLPYGAYSLYISDESFDNQGQFVGETAKCLIRLMEGLDGIQGEEYSVYIEITASKESLSQRVDDTFALLKDKLQIGIGETRLVNPLAQETRAEFVDLADQSLEYREMLQTFVQYGLLQESQKFEPYIVLRWKHILPKYFHAVYGVELNYEGCGSSDVLCALKRTTIETPSGSKNLFDVVMKNAQIPFMKIAAQDDLYVAHDMIRLALAGFDVQKYSKEDVQNIVLYGDSHFREEVEAIEELEYFLYGPKRTTVGDLSSYTPFYKKKVFLMHPKKGLMEAPNAPKGGYAFDGTGYTYERYIETLAQENFENAIREAHGQLVACVNSIEQNNCSVNYLSEYTKAYEEYVDLRQSFEVVTRASLFDFLMGEGDLELFDAELENSNYGW